MELVQNKAHSWLSKNSVFDSEITHEETS